MHDFPGTGFHRDRKANLIGSLQNIIGGPCQDFPGDGNPVYRKDLFGLKFIQRFLSVL
jgi:hypothetical protein